MNLRMKLIITSLFLTNIALGNYYKDGEKPQTIYYGKDSKVFTGEEILSGNFKEKNIYKDGKLVKNITYLKNSRREHLLNKKEYTPPTYYKLNSNELYSVKKRFT